MLCGAFLILRWFYAAMRCRNIMSKLHDYRRPLLRERLFSLLCIRNAANDIPLLIHNDGMFQCTDQIAPECLPVLIAQNFAFCLFGICQPDCFRLMGKFIDPVKEFLFHFLTSFHTPYYTIPERKIQWVQREKAMQFAALYYIITEISIG